jgi:6-phosphogluconolactonase (cycloisomerase 2 family)
MRAVMHAFVGCFTSAQRHGLGRGIRSYAVDTDTGRWTEVQVVEATNPSFLLIDRSRLVLYAVHGDEEAVSAFRIDAHSGELSALGFASTQGRNPVHLALDPSARFLVVANLTGSVAVLPIAPDGRLCEASCRIEPSGQCGPHRKKQSGSRPHGVRFHAASETVFIADRGFDCVHQYRLEMVSGTLLPIDPPASLLRPGAGPRHVEWHPTLAVAYVVNEIDSTLTVCRVESLPTRLRPVQILPTAPDSYTGESNAAEVMLCASGRFLYVSNRGHDSIGVFAVGEDGRLRAVDWSVTEGHWPRHFALDSGRRLMFAANEKSHSIVGFRVDADSGRLSRFGPRIDTGSPTCIALLDRAAPRP